MAKCYPCHETVPVTCAPRKVRDGEDAIASTRDAARRVRYPTGFSAMRIVATALLGSSRACSTINNQTFSLVLILISDVSVRCTGHLSAISINFDRCSDVSGPVN
jgi:hypothetical protein